MNRATTKTRRVAKFASKTQNQALSAAITALDVAIAASEPLAEAHTAAELAGQAAQRAGASEASMEKLERACDAAERKWMRACGVADRAASAMLHVAIERAADAELKQEVFRASYLDRNTLDIWDAEDAAKALAAAKRDLSTLASGPAPRGDPVKGRILCEWNAARDKAASARAASAAAGCDDDETYDAYCIAQEAWETLTPPSVEALVEVMASSLVEFGPLSMTHQGVNCPRSMRDLLDSGDAAKVIAARIYMHLLRMTGSDSPALLTPPIGGLFPAFDIMKVTDEKPGDIAAGWEEHHRLAEHYAGRLAAFATWEMPEVAKAITDPGGIQAVWHYSAAVHAHALTIISEYERRGGRFSLVRQPDGGVWFGTMLARDGSREAGEIEYLVANHRPIRHAVATIIEKRNGILGDADAAQPNSLSSDVRHAAVAQ